MQTHYVYGLVDPRTSKIMYIGKGSGNRMFQHVQKTYRNVMDSHNYTKYNALKEILMEYEDIAYRLIYETENELEAYEKEQEAIQHFNTLYPHGWNLICKKAGCPVGTIRSKETRKKMSQAKLLMSDETKQKISKANIGKVYSQEAREKISQNNRLRKLSDKTKEKISKSQKLYWKKKREEKCQN